MSFVLVDVYVGRGFSRRLITRVHRPECANARRARHKREVDTYPEPVDYRQSQRIRPCQACKP